MGPSDNIFMNHALDSVTEAAVSGPMKSMKMEQPVRGRGQGVSSEQGGAIINIYTLPPVLTGSPSLVPMVTTPHLVMVTTVSAAMAPHLPR